MKDCRTPRARCWLATLGLVSCLALPVACGRVGIDIYAVTAPDRGPSPEDEDAGDDESVEPDAADVDAEPADAGDGVVDADAALPARDAQIPRDANAADGARDAAPGVDAGLQAQLALRYDFSGSGTTVQDRIGSANAEILGGAQLDGSGRLTLDGNNDFVNMPNGLISKWSSVTVMAWLTWSGGPCWQRVFDFGSSSNGEDSVGSATSALSLSASSCPNNVVAGLFELNGNVRAANGPALTAGTPVQLTLVMDGARDVLTIYLNGAQVGENSVTSQLSQLNDVNNWLGRSQWMQDRFLQASFDELRVYGGALSAAEVSAAYARGPNAP